MSTSKKVLIVAVCCWIGGYFATIYGMNNNGNTNAMNQGPGFDFFGTSSIPSSSSSSSSQPTPLRGGVYPEASGRGGQASSSSTHRKNLAEFKEARNKLLSEIAAAIKNSDFDLFEKLMESEDARKYRVKPYSMLEEMVDNERCDLRMILTNVVLKDGQMNDDLRKIRHYFEQIPKRLPANKEEAVQELRDALSERNVGIIGRILPSLGKWYKVNSNELNQILGEVDKEDLEEILITALMRHNFEVAEALLDRGVIINQVTINQSERKYVNPKFSVNDRLGNALCSIAQSSHIYGKYGHGDVIIVDALLKAGVSVDARNHAGRTALMIAAKETNPGMVRLLLQAHATVDAIDDDGNTALYYSIADLVFAEQHHWHLLAPNEADFKHRLASLYHIIIELLRHGANPEIENRTGKTPLGLAETIRNQMIRSQVIALINNIRAEYMADKEQILKPYVIDDIAGIINEY